VALRGLRLLILPVAAVAIAAGASAAEPTASQSLSPNPCITEQARSLRCPDLVMKRPFGLYVQRSRDRSRLRAGNSIDSVGAGPAELHGVRSSSRFMRARQRIYRRAGGRIGLTTGARLEFKFADGPLAAHDQGIEVYTTRPDTLYGASFLAI